MRVGMNSSESLKIIVFNIRKIIIFGGMAALAIGWLLPNKVFPWLAAWNEGFAFLGGALITGGVIIGNWKNKSLKTGISWPISIFIILCLGVVWLQWVAGLLLFYGDAIIVNVYLLGFGFCVYSGVFLGNELEKDKWLDALLFTISISGLVTAFIVLVQWTEVYNLAVFIQEIELNGRPFGNLGQVNHANTLLFMSCCSMVCLSVRKKIGIFATIGGHVIIIMCMIILSSRTGLVQIFMLLIYSVWINKSIVSKKNIYAYIIFICCGLFFFAVPKISQFLLLRNNMRILDLSESSGDLRRYLWIVMGDAVVKRPFLGYGWLQNASAQIAVAMQHPPLRYEFTYAHNLLLDLVIWCGIPLGVVLILLLSIWLIKYVRVSRVNSDYLLMIPIGILLHCLLEYPFAYAYFLLPMGLIIGFIEAKNRQFGIFTFNKGLSIVVFAVYSLLLIQTGVEISYAINADTVLRMRSAKIGIDVERYDPPKLLLLNQLDALLKFRSMEPKPKMESEHLIFMEKVAHRYANFAILADLAYAKELNGMPEDRDKYIALGCAIYGEKNV